MQSDATALDPDIIRQSTVPPVHVPARRKASAPKPMEPEIGLLKRMWRSIFGGPSTEPKPAARRDAPATRSVLGGTGAVPPPRYSDDTAADIEEIIRPATRSIGVDRRELVPADKLGFKPWTTICRLEITYATGKRCVASGFLVHPAVVATSAHVILHPDPSIGRATEIAVTPGFDQGPPRRRRLVSTTFRIRSGWGDPGPQGFLAANDYGAVLLSDPAAFAGFGVLEWCDPAALDLANNFAVSGYPAEKHGQWRNWNLVTEIGEVALRHVIQTTEGQSGSPLFQVKDGRVLVAGIHSRNIGDSNAARRVTDRVIGDYRAWTAEITPTA